MNIHKYFLLLMALVVFSCNEQEFQSNTDSDEVILDDGIETTYVSFQVNAGGGLETDNTILFQNQSSAIIEYQWDFGDGTTETSENPDHRYAEPGKYTVTLTGTTSTGDVLSFSKDLFVRENGASLDVLFISFEDSTLNYFDLSANTSAMIYKVPYNPAGVLALDESSKTVYYYDYTNNNVIANGLQSDNPVVVLRDYPGVSDMEFDQVSGKLYIALSFDDSIIAYDPANGNVSQLPNSATPGRFGKVRDMDFKNGHLYTITPTQNYESVYKVDMTQGNVDQLINYAEGGYGYGVAYDDRNNHIYFNNVEAAALMRADPDGSNIVKVIDLDRFGTVSFTGLALTGLEVVETRNLLMWSDWEDGQLHVFDLNTSQESVFQADGLLGKFVPFENTYY